MSEIKDGADATDPIMLSANRPAARFYKGGTQIARFRGGIDDEPYTPEDWVGSTVTMRGEQFTGLTTLPDGRLLRDDIGADPVRWLGADHVRAFGADPKLLVKLLDAGQRLPVHAHPDGEFAQRTLGAAHGKAEAWYILTPGVVHVGLVEGTTLRRLAELVATQDAETLLNMLHRVPVQPGDRVFVPAGMLHAIGEGVFLVEVQEPEDLSILLEWRDFAIDGATHGHLGLGFDLALEAVDTSATLPDVLESLIVRNNDPNAGLAADAAEFFRLDRIDVAGIASLDEGFAVLVVLHGGLTLRGGEQDLPLVAGSTVLLPATSTARELHGAGTVLAARPPLPPLETTNTITSSSCATTPSLPAPAEPGIAR